MSPLLEAGTLDFISHSEDQTRRLGTRLGELAQAGDIVALMGNLGTGKTRLAQGFGLGLGVSTDEVINSPTFTFINQYQGRFTLYHLDLYRLSGPDESETLGLDDFFYDDGVCLIEWADRLENRIPSERLEVHLHHISDTKRRITLKAFGDSYHEMLNVFKKTAFNI